MGNIGFGVAVLPQPGAEGFRLPDVRGKITAGIVGIASRLLERFGQKSLTQIEEALPGFGDLARQAWQRFELGAAPWDAILDSAREYLERAVFLGNITELQKQTALETIMFATAAGAPGRGSPVLPQNVQLGNRPETYDRSPEGRRRIQREYWLKGEPLPEQRVAGLLYVRAMVPDPSPTKKRGTEVPLVEKGVVVFVSDVIYSLVASNGVCYMDALANPTKDRRHKSAYVEWCRGSQDLPQFINGLLKKQYEDAVEKGEKARLMTFEGDVLVMGPVYGQVMDALGLHTPGAPEADKKGIGKDPDINPTLDAKDWESAWGVSDGRLNVSRPVESVSRIILSATGVLGLAGGGFYLGGLLSRGLYIPEQLFISSAAMCLGLVSTAVVLARTLSPPPIKVAIRTKPFTVQDEHGIGTPVHSILLNASQYLEANCRSLADAFSEKASPNILLFPQLPGQVGITVQPSAGSQYHRRLIQQQWLCIKQLFAGNIPTALLLTALAKVIFGTLLPGVDNVHNAGRPDPDIQKQEARLSGQAAGPMGQVYVACPGTPNCVIDEGNPKHTPGAPPNEQPRKNYDSEAVAKGTRIGEEHARRKSPPRDLVVQLFGFGAGGSGSGIPVNALALANNKPDQFKREVRNHYSPGAVGVIYTYGQQTGIFVRAPNGKLELSEGLTTYHDILDHLIRVNGWVFRDDEERHLALIFAKALYAFVHDIPVDSPEHIYTEDDYKLMIKILSQVRAEERQKIDEALDAQARKTPYAPRRPRAPKEIGRSSARAYGASQVQRRV